jgi:hypothetical protein
VRTRRSLRLPLALGTGLATVASLVVMGSMAPAQALSAPGGLNADARNDSTIVLSWSPVTKASAYQVQVDTSSNFSSPDVSVSTVNTHYVPTKTLPQGTVYWRVRSVQGGIDSGWSKSTSTVSPVGSPQPISPADGAHLQQPQEPPLLRWSPVQGATSYTVQVDGDVDMIGASSYTTKGTSLVVPVPLTTGDWYWTVTASKGAGLTSLPSAIQQFNIDPLAAPQITYPVDDINQSLEDVALDWTPVPGAKTYDLQVALDQDFNNITLTVTGIKSTRYSPPTTLNSDQFWWRVRAVDLAGQQTPWTASLNGFERTWPETATPVFPLGAAGSPSDITDAKQYFQWTPVKHATQYQLQVSTDTNFSPGVTKTCTTAQTTYTPRSGTDCAFPSGATVLYWHVRPIDYPYSGGLPGLFSQKQAFTYSPPAGPGGAWDPQAVVTGLKVAADGDGIENGAKGCAGVATDITCSGIPTTPVLSWDPVPGAAFYEVMYAQDANFTTSEIPTIPTTSNTMFQLHTADSLSSLPDSQAGKAYYWHVVPCQDISHCGPSPVSQATPLPDTATFRKQSPAVTGLTSSDPNASEITFSWNDYHDTNQATTWNGETSNQTARSYRIEVDNDSSFATPVDTRVVDQATVTEWDDLYPDGSYWWRVQALDDESQGQAWSTVHTFTKTSPPVTPTSPVNGSSVSGTTPFRWDAAPFAASYTIEVYRNNDVTFSSANRVFTATVKTTAYVPTTPLPASGAKYLWRVRRTDASGNPGPWSTARSFFSTGATPSLATPHAGAWAKSRNTLFEWAEVPGATSYLLNLTGPITTKYSTVATAYAPTTVLRDGTYTWSVTALDSGGKPLGTSADRSFRVDGTAPTVTAVTPQQLTPRSTIKATFSEKVKGVSNKTMKLYRVKGTKKTRVSAVVTVLKKGKAASLNPKSRLKAGSYLVVFVASKIRDVAGNNLAPSQAAPTLRSARGSTGTMSWTTRR